MELRQTPTATPCSTSASWRVLCRREVLLTGACASTKNREVTFCVPELQRSLTAHSPLLTCPFPSIRCLGLVHANKAESLHVCLECHLLQLPQITKRQLRPSLEPCLHANLLPQRPACLPTCWSLPRTSVFKFKLGKINSKSGRQTVLLKTCCCTRALPGSPRAGLPPRAGTRELSGTRPPPSVPRGPPEPGGHSSPRCGLHCPTCLQDS